LKSWEKTDTGRVSTRGAYGPKNAAITRMPAPSAATESPHFSDRTALVWRCYPRPWPMQEASALPKTRNQFCYKLSGARHRTAERLEADCLTYHLDNIAMVI